MSIITDNWETPAWLFDKLNAEHNFILDLAATEQNRKCARWCVDYLKCSVDDLKWYTAGEEGAFFCNPPYSRKLIKPFIEKMWHDSQYFKIVIIVKVDTSTRWWATFWDYENDKGKPGAHVKFLSARVKFVAPPGLDGKSGPSFPSCVLIFHRRGL